MPDLCSEDIYAQGYALMLYNIVDDRNTFQYRDERFDFDGDKARAARAETLMRLTEPYLLVCPIGKLRELANA